MHFDTDLAIFDLLKNPNSRSEVSAKTWWLMDEHLTILL